MIVELSDGILDGYLKDATEAVSIEGVCEEPVVTVLAHDLKCLIASARRCRRIEETGWKFDSSHVRMMTNAIRAIHRRRSMVGAYGEDVHLCAEDRQPWPCETIQTLRCPGKDGSLSCALDIGHVEMHHG